MCRGLRLTFCGAGTHFGALGQCGHLCSLIWAGRICRELHMCYGRALLEEQALKSVSQKTWSTIIQFTMPFRLWEESVIQECCLETGHWVLGPILWPKSQKSFLNYTELYYRRTSFTVVCAEITVSRVLWSCPTS